MKWLQEYGWISNGSHMFIHIDKTKYLMTMNPDGIYRIYTDKIHERNVVMAVTKDNLKSINSIMDDLVING